MTLVSVPDVPASGKITVSEKLKQLVSIQLALHQLRDNQTASVHFKDSSYSVKAGGYHPVEIGIQRFKDTFSLLYITDYSYVGQAYPELDRDIDFDFGNQVAFTRFSGWQSITTPESTLVTI